VCCVAYVTRIVLINFYDIIFQATLLYVVPPIVLLLGQNKNVTHEHFQSLKLICNGAGPVKEVDAEKVLARSNNKNVRFCQGKVKFVFSFNQIFSSCYVRKP